MKRYFGSLSFYRQALMIGIPVMLQSLIQSLVSLVDNFMVAGLGDVKMSGVSIAGQILFVFIVLSNAICAAGGIYMTQFSGAKNRDGMRQALRFKFYLIGAFIAVYLLVCFVFPRQILNLMVIGNAEAEAILDAGEEYMRLMGFMGVPFCISVVLATSMREIGQVRAPLVISVIGTLVNTGLNWVLIYGNLGAPRLEVRGAAYATLIARFVEMGLYIFYVRRNPQPFLGKRGEKLPTDWKLFGNILRRGWLMLFSEVLWVASETVTTAVRHQHGNFRDHRKDAGQRTAGRSAEAEDLDAVCGPGVRMFYDADWCIGDSAYAAGVRPPFPGGAGDLPGSGAAGVIVYAAVGLQQRAVFSGPGRRRYSDGGGGRRLCDTACGHSRHIASGTADELGSGADVRRIEAYRFCEDRHCPSLAEKGEVGEKPDGAGRLMLQWHMMRKQHGHAGGVSWIRTGLK